MTDDRTYWRAQDDKRLIDEAKHCPSIELCIALGERLDGANADAGLTSYLTEQLKMSSAANQVMLCEIDALERQIDDMMGVTGND